MASDSMDRASSNGFTLIELLITLSIAIILTSTAASSFSSLHASSAVTTSINTFVAHLQLARSESIKRGYRTVMCPSLNQTNCTGGVRWDMGFILFTDINGNRVRDTGEQLLKVGQASHNSIEIHSTPGRKKLTFRSTGMSPGSNATIRFCPPKGGSQSKAVIINNSGRPRVSDKMATGAAYSC